MKTELKTEYIIDRFNRGTKILKITMDKKDWLSIKDKVYIEVECDYPSTDITLGKKITSPIDTSGLFFLKEDLLSSKSKKIQIKDHEMKIDINGRKFRNVKYLTGTSWTTDKNTAYIKFYLRDKSGPHSWKK